MPAAVFLPRNLEELHKTDYHPAMGKCAHLEVEV